MSNTPDPSALLMGGGSKSAKFTNVGDTIVGEIVDLKVTQQTDMDGTPKTWDNGDPRWQLVVTLATEDRDDADDDGRRNLYVKGGKKSPTMEKAVADAVAAAGAREILLGGKLAVQFTGHGEPSRPGLSAPKHYAAQYQAPTQGVDLGNVFDAPAATPAPQPVAAPATGFPPPAAPVFGQPIAS